LSKSFESDLPVAFYFMVKFKDGSGIWEVPFQEVSGIKTRMDVEEVREGGENRFVHKLPKQIKSDNLVLKTAVQTKDASLVNWCKETLASDFSNPIKPMDVHVMLLNHEGQALMHWHVHNAYPVSWEIGAFQSTKNEVAIETLELAYTHSTREDP
jgi:phage tail-like protein